MSRYRRANAKGGTYFFTVVTYRRQPFLCDDMIRAALRNAVQHTRAVRPFKIDAWVLLPDHLHCIWTLPEGDADFGIRWAGIKQRVTRACGAQYFRRELMTESKKRRKESTLWQRRFWEHQIRDDKDFRHHMDYIHYNPVKHSLAKWPGAWPYSTFHRYVEKNDYSKNWDGGDMVKINAGFGE